MRKQEKPLQAFYSTFGVFWELRHLFISPQPNLSNSRKRFETLMKKETDSKQFIIESRKILKNMKNRIITFFVVTLVLMGFFWYYVSTFCSVYRQTQVAWIEGTIITFLFCIVIYAILYFIVTLMRYIGLKCHFSYLYSLSSYFIWVYSYIMYLYNLTNVYTLHRLLLILPR